jgi:putrescine transport system ATP-binding protein
VQVATPSQVYEQPGTRWVADFIGDVNLLEGRIKTADPSGVVIDSPTAGSLRVDQAADAAIGTHVWVALRPEKVRIAREPPASAHENCVAGEVWDIGYLGDVSIYKVRLANGFLMKASVANVSRLVKRPIVWDDKVWLSWTPDAGVVLTR